MSTRRLPGSTGSDHDRGETGRDPQSFPSLHHGYTPTPLCPAPPLPPFFPGWVHDNSQFYQWIARSKISQYLHTHHNDNDGGYRGMAGKKCTWGNIVGGRGNVGVGDVLGGKCPEGFVRIPLSLTPSSPNVDSFTA